MQPASCLAMPCCGLPGMQLRVFSSEPAVEAGKPAHLVRSTSNWSTWQQCRPSTPSSTRARQQSCSFSQASQYAQCSLERPAERLATFPNSLPQGQPAAPPANTAGNQPASAQPAVSTYWQDLLSTPESDAFGARARSASDANVLRRKGHLKEQDKFIDFLLRMHDTHTSQEVMRKVERWIIEHRQDPRGSRLTRMVPTIGSFFTPLKLVEAFKEYDEFFALSRRKYVPPNFAEMRHVLNIAQVHSSADSLRLITFDADGTLYADGAHMEHDSEMIAHIINLMRRNVHVAIVTAAGYPGDAWRFEHRVEGLLASFNRLDLPTEITDRFHIMGGECNYLLRVVGPNRRLAFVPDAEWKSPVMMSWAEPDIQAVLTAAEACLLETAQRLRLPVTVIRKERAVGVIPMRPTIYEVLEEMAITVQEQLAGAPLPFCAFNGGSDVFVDIGNKSLGLEALMRYLQFGPAQVLHVGDRFTVSGNDAATRDCCSILWVANPEETDFFVKLLLQDISSLKAQPYIE